MSVNGFIDSYASYNPNNPGNTANGQTNDLYNFNDKTNRYDLAAARLTLNHDPAPWGARVDLLYGRANKLVNLSSQADFVEQAFSSLKPTHAKGLELDLGKFVTSAGAEVMESKDNWNYSRSLLFAWAIPYYHFGIRSSIPLSTAETIGVQEVNGWNNITKSTGGATTGLTSAFVKPKYTIDTNIYTGTSNTDTQHGYRNLIDSVLLLTPNAKFNAYINYDYAQNKNSISGGQGNNLIYRWQGVAFAARQQLSGKFAAAGRVEYFADSKGFATGAAQHLKEFTGTGEYKLPQGLLTRLEYRRDWSDVAFFHKGNVELVDAQSTLTLGVVAIFGPLH